MIHVSRLAAVAAGLILLAACSTGTTPANEGGAPKLPDPPASSQPPADHTKDGHEAGDQDGRNERGNLVKELGEVAGFGPMENLDGPQGATFSIDKIEIDPPCDPYMPEPKGHLLRLHVRAATGSDQRYADLLGSVLNSFSFSVLGKDGVTKPADFGTCSEDAMTPPLFGPNQKYTLLVELDVPVASGRLILDAGLTNGGWEWKY